MNRFAGRLRGTDLVVLGGQPCTLPPLRMRSVAAGYIANQAALCRELGIALTATEAEVLAHAYRRWGTALCSHVWGEWAAALFDERTGELILTHDALGSCTLFHAAGPDQIVFASHLDALLAVASPGPLDEDYLAQTLADVDDHGALTPWRAIRRVPQCFSVVWRAGRLQLQRSYQPADQPSRTQADATALARQARALMTEAVAGALPSNGRAWCELSGGLDSSSVVSLAAGALGVPIETFSVVFSRSHEADESVWIDRVLADFPVPSHRLDADTVPPFSLLPVGFQPEPGGTALIVAFNQARIELLRSHGVQVMLTGMCGDAVFVGDSPQPYYLADQRNPLRLLRELRHWADRSPLQRPMGY